MTAIANCCYVLVGYGARGVDATAKLLVVLKSEGSFAIPAPTQRAQVVCAFFQTRQCILPAGTESDAQSSGG
jgi:hypothetical protein